MDFPKRAADDYPHKKKGGRSLWIPTRAGNWVIGRALRDAFEPGQLLALGAAAVLAPFALPGTARKLALMRRHAGVLLPLALTGVVLFAFVFWNRGVSSVGASAAGFTMHLLPVFGAVFAIIFLGESFGLFHALGIVTILAGVVLASRRRSNIDRGMNRPGSFMLYQNRSTMVHCASLALILLGGLWLAGSAAAQSPPTHQHSFGDAERWAHVFDDPKRDDWQKPHEVIRALALEPGSVIADIGAGTGYFAMRFANMVPQSRIYGVDVEPDMVKYLAERAKREKRDNVVAIAGAPDDPRLPEKVDLILLVNTYHHLDRRTDYFKKVRQSLKRGGRIAVIDFRMEAPQGPPQAARLAPERVIAELKTAGYTLAQDHSFLPSQYFLVFRPVP